MKIKKYLKIEEEFDRLLINIKKLSANAINKILNRRDIKIKLAQRKVNLF